MRPASEALEVRRVPAGTTASFSVAQDWGTGFQASINLANSQATSVNNWVLQFDYSASIDSIWNASIVSHVGNHYVIQGADWNNTIPANGSVSFGFNGSPGHTTAAPTNYLLNGASMGGGGGGGG
ncbi:cellulose binding domain-containing protein, partial [Singulisphaera rosea]